MKFLILIAFFFISLNAKTINFTEEKYIDALNRSFYKNGQIEFLKNEIKIKYKNSSKVLIYKDEKIFIKDEKKTNEIDGSKQIALSILFTLLNSIHKNQYDYLKDFFKIKKDKDIYELMPKDELKNYIKFIEFKKTKNLDFLNLYMRNGDKTIIREKDD